MFTIRAAYQTAIFEIEIEILTEKVKISKFNTGARTNWPRLKFRSRGEKDVLSPGLSLKCL
jgi:hypothetical protein